MNELVSCLNWDPVKCLGQGGFGRVMLWKHRQTGQEIGKILVAKIRFGDEVYKIEKLLWSKFSLWLR